MTTLTDLSVFRQPTLSQVTPKVEAIPDHIPAYARTAEAIHVRGQPQ